VTRILTATTTFALAGWLMVAAVLLRERLRDERAAWKVTE
jgi:hypothetical protein